MSGFVHLNGALVPAAEARVSLFDHGLLYGDGLFETLRVYGGRFFRLQAHLQRLRDGAGQLDLPLPWPPEALAAAVRETVRANGLGDGSVRLTVTRGAGPPVPDPAACDEACCFVVTRPWSPPAAVAWERGLSACIAGRHPQTCVPGVKATSYLPFQLARAEARRRGFDEALLPAGDYLVEGATSNLFLVRDGLLLTPGLESGCLPGVTRAAVLETAAALGVPARERAAPIGWLAEAREVFLTNSLLELVPVLRVGDRVLGDAPGPVTRRLRDAFRALVAAELAP